MTPSITCSRDRLPSENRLLPAGGTLSSCSSVRSASRPIGAFPAVSLVHHIRQSCGWKCTPVARPVAVTAPLPVTRGRCPRDVPVGLQKLAEKVVALSHVRGDRADGNTVAVFRALVRAGLVQIRLV